MALPIFNTIPVMTRINLVTLAQISGVTRFRGYEYMGLIPYDVAKNLAADPHALVMATRSYFREGSSIEFNRITYVAIRQHPTSPIILIPEPLIQAGSVEVVASTTTIVQINGSYSNDEIAIILSSNGITNFTIRQEFV